MTENDFIKWCDANGINNTADDMKPWRECWESAEKSQQKTITTLEQKVKRLREAMESLPSKIAELPELPGEIPDNIYSAYKENINAKDIFADLLRVLVRTCKNEFTQTVEQALKHTERG